MHNGQWADTLTSNEHDNIDDRFDHVQSPKRPAPGHLKVGESPENVSKPRRKEGRDQVEQTAEKGNGFGNDKSNNPPDEDDGDPDGPALESMLLAVF